jgi:hypothetical protein
MKTMSHVFYFTGYPRSTVAEKCNFLVFFVIALNYFIVIFLSSLLTKGLTEQGGGGDHLPLLWRPEGQARQASDSQATTMPSYMYITLPADIS